MEESENVVEDLWITSYMSWTFRVLHHLKYRMTLNLEKLSRSTHGKG